MKNLILFIVISFYYCVPFKECNLEGVLFEGPSETAFTCEIQDLWTYSDSVLSLICEKNKFNDMYLKIDSGYVHYRHEDIEETCTRTYNCASKRREVIEVLVNREGQILFEGKLIEMEAIDSLFQLYYLNHNNNIEYISMPRRAEISVKWDIEANFKVINRVISNLQKGYVSSIASLYPESSLYAICDSVLLNKEFIEKIYPFKLSLTFPGKFTLGGRIPPPPSSR